MHSFVPSIYFSTQKLSESVNIVIVKSKLAPVTRLNDELQMSVHLTDGVITEDFLAVDLP